MELLLKEPFQLRAILTGPSTPETRPFLRDQEAHGLQRPKLVVIYSLEKSAEASLLDLEGVIRLLALGNGLPRTGAERDNGSENRSQDQEEVY